MRYKIDLSKLTDKEILEHAAANIEIRWLRKQLFERSKTDDLLNFEVDKLVDADACRPERKAKLSDLEKASRQVNKLSESELAELAKLIAERQAS